MDSIFLLTSGFCVFFILGAATYAITEQYNISMENENMIAMMLPVKNKETKINNENNWKYLTLCHLVAKEKWNQFIAAFYENENNEQKVDDNYVMKKKSITLRPPVTMIQ